MNSEALLNEALGYLDELNRVFADLASRSEHQVQRSDYLAFQEQIQEMQKSSIRIWTILMTPKLLQCH